MKRFLSLTLALLMLISSMTLLFSCKKDENDGEGKADNEQKVYEEDSIFYERSLISDDLEAVDYGGREFRIVTHQPKEFVVEEEERNQGNLITDAKFARNEAVEKRFNVNITLGYTGTYSEVSTYVSKTVLAGTDEFDLLMGMAVDTGSLVLKKVFLNWYDIENVNFSKPWWVSSNTDELTVNGVAPIAVSDFNFSSITSTFCMVFNKNLAASYEMGNLYQLVLDGKWTFDKLLELVKGVYVDDGNDKRDENDFYGMTMSNGMTVNAFLWAFDNPICVKDEDGVPQIAIKTDKINNIVNNIYDLIYNTGSVYYDAGAVSGTSYPTDMFLAKKTIFVPVGLGNFTTTGFRNFEDDYGVLPMPKYDENQAEYFTMADGYHTVLAVPKTCRDTAFVGTIVEALSAETWKTVTPTFYEIALKTRYLRDAESKLVLDLVINGRTFDFGYIYDGWQGFSFTLQRMMAAGNNNFESQYTKVLPSARYRYKSVIKAFAKI
ncbi:MAG: hypothetical protein IKV53_03620 [Clostridia bacterium]|nr:hypothetical protein [Clostridia bacterium]